MSERTIIAGEWSLTENLRRKPRASIEHGDIAHGLEPSRLSSMENGYFGLWSIPQIKVPIVCGGLILKGGLHLTKGLPHDFYT